MDYISAANLYSSKTATVFSILTVSELVKLHSFLLCKFYH